MSDSIDEFKAALGGDVVVPGLEQTGGLSMAEILATRGWFDGRRRRLMSSGGRPTNPAWTLKRQVSFAPETWQSLKSIAETWSALGPKFGPGQVAAFLLETAVSSASGRCLVAEVVAESRAEEANEDLEPRFKEWREPELFFGSAAA